MTLLTAKIVAFCSLSTAMTSFFATHLNLWGADSSRLSGRPCSMKSSSNCTGVDVCGKYECVFTAGGSHRFQPVGRQCIDNSSEECLDKVCSQYIWSSNPSCSGRWDQVNQSQKRACQDLTP